MTEVRATMKVNWKGKELGADIDAEIPKAMDDTTAAAAIFSKSNHPGWQNRTGVAEGSIRGDPARKDTERGWIALFGSFDVNYFLWLEIGARGRAGDNTIRRGADTEFPNLAERLRTRLRAAGLVVD